jgi:hypothetical protein
MKSSIILLAFIALIISSCTTAYKTGQTPDDVYFSPERPANEYVRVEKDDDRYYEGSDEYYEDRYLRMKVMNRTRWSDLDDYYYYNRYNYSYNNIYYNNPWNPYNYWNHYYNPYSTGVIILNPKNTTANAGPRRINLNAYNNSQLLNSNYTNPKVQNNGYRPYTPSSGNSRARNSDAGRSIRDIFGNNNNSTNNTPSRSSTTTSSSSSSSGSSSGSTAPRRKF